MKKKKTYPKLVKVWDGKWEIVGVKNVKLTKWRKWKIKAGEWENKYNLMVQERDFLIHELYYKTDVQEVSDHQVREKAIEDNIDFLVKELGEIK